MFATLGLDSVFLRVCSAYEVNLMEIWSFLSRVLWFFAGMGVLFASYLLAGGCAFGALGMCLPTSC
ncbi:hypothetical protein DY000_02041241 [Brassica cretica]|uniref:Uncharacterized protein n=1 Tax=Brassica cretica TaxID=69181 RepID=A0ABQ7BGM3_BRACR|nr:hypothetical protein DY000_02041241 [Brassica cretica]